MFTDNAINDAIKDLAAHNLASALADVGVTATRSGALHSSSEACEIAGYGRVFSRDARWVVQATNGHDYLVDNDELADELTEIVEAVQRIS